MKAGTTTGMSTGSRKGGSDDNAAEKSGSK
jgi:hypothetical protein